MLRLSSMGIDFHKDPFGSAMDVDIGVNPFWNAMFFKSWVVFDGSILKIAIPGNPSRSLEYQEFLIDDLAYPRVLTRIIGFGFVGIVFDVIERVDGRGLGRCADGGKCKVGVTTVVEECLDLIRDPMSVSAPSAGV